MKSKTDYSDMSIGLNLFTSLTTWDGDPSSYVVHVSGTIMPIGGDDPEEEVGSVQAILCRLVSRPSWKWRERSAVKITERTHEKDAQALHGRREGRHPEAAPAGAGADLVVV